MDIHGEYTGCAKDQNPPGCSGEWDLGKPVGETLGRFHHCGRFIWSLVGFPIMAVGYHHESGMLASFTQQTDRQTDRIRLTE